MAPDPVKGKALRRAGRGRGRHPDRRRHDVLVVDDLAVLILLFAGCPIGPASLDGTGALFVFSLPHPHQALSAAFVRSAPPGQHADGNGLYLFVQPTGTRSWVQRLVVRGRRREFGLGAAALVPLAKAREQALANRMLAHSGGDRVRVSRPDGCAVGGSQARHVDRDQHDGPRVDHFGDADEGEARAPCAAVRAGAGGPRRGVEARRRQSTRVPDAKREGDLGVDAAEDAPAAPGHRCGPRLPLVVPRLGGRGDGSPAGDLRRGVGPRGPEQDGGGLRTFGPVRAPTVADGRLGSVWMPIAGLRRSTRNQPPGVSGCNGTAGRHSNLHRRGRLQFPIW